MIADGVSGRVRLRMLFILVDIRALITISDRFWRAWSSQQVTLAKRRSSSSSSSSTSGNSVLPLALGNSPVLLPFLWVLFFFFFFDAMVKEMSASATRAMWREMPTPRENREHKEAGKAC